MTKKNSKIIRFLFFLVTILFIYLSLVLPLASRKTSFQVNVGSVVNQNFSSPIDITYESTVLTQIAKDEAYKSVPNVYLPADPEINREQLIKQKNTLAFITSIRSDQFSSNQQKIADLRNALKDDLSSETADMLLSISDAEWQTIQNESSSVLERTMRNNIREYQLTDIINNIPGIISYNIPPNQIGIIKALTTPFVTANSIFSEEETNAQKQKAADQVKPVVRSYVKNQIIVVRGQVLTEEHWEVLNKLGLVRSDTRIEDNISSIAITLVVAFCFTFYYFQNKNPFFSEPRYLLIISAGFIIFLMAARIIVPDRSIIPYLFPLPAYALILVTLFNLEVGLVFSLFLGILVTHGPTSTIELTIFYLVTSVIASLVITRGRNITFFIWSALGIAVSGALVITAFRFINPVTDLIGLLTLYGASVLNGIASSSLALLLQFLLAQILGIPTPMYLIELSRSDHPLLKKILTNSPGTYQHSHQVANLAEQAASTIGADSILTRVGTYFHDAGKSLNPTFFVENQSPGNIDSHDEKDPVITAQTIIAHVHDGVKLAEKYHLPQRVQDFIREHHGVHLAKYQYNQAVTKLGNSPDLVDAELFRYPGPKPQSKETAILMLADICEAKARSVNPHSENEIRELVKSVIEALLKEGSLDESLLTLRDLSNIQDSFIKTFSNTYHPRVRYPDEGILKDASTN